MNSRCGYLVPILLLGVMLVVSARVQAENNKQQVYQYTKASRDGIGKVYMGREISQVMGHLGAAWLERSTRLQEERTDLLLKNLQLSPTATVVDLGAGTGYFSLPIAKRLAAGQVIAVDIQQEMLDIIAQRMKAAKINNIKLVLASEDNPGLLANTADLVLLVDAYHEFAYPYEVMRHIVQALKPGGRVVLIEYRAEDPKVLIKRLHKMTEVQVKKELMAVGLQWLETRDFLPQQHFLIFQKPIEP